MSGCWLDPKGSEQVPESGCCKHDTESRRSIKDETFVDLLSNCQHLMKTTTEQRPACAVFVSWQSHTDSTSLPFFAARIDPRVHPSAVSLVTNPGNTRPRPQHHSAVPRSRSPHSGRQRWRHTVNKRCRLPHRGPRTMDPFIRIVTMFKWTVSEATK
jgi:hypothetical protein